MSFYIYNSELRTTSGPGLRLSESESLALHPLGKVPRATFKFRGALAYFTRIAGLTGISTCAQNPRLQRS